MKLKPCPCGAEGDPTIEQSYHCADWYEVQCPSIAPCGWIVRGPTKELAIAGWNALPRRKVKRGK